MKKQKTRILKMNLSLVAMALLVSTLSSVSQAVAADDTAKAVAAPTGGNTSVGSPFGDGTGKRQLTPAEKQELLEYAENSNAILSDALDSAKGRGFAEANKIYLAAIKKVVIASFESKPRSELLLRISLNQALEMTFGVPTADGKGVVAPGGLAKSVNQELLTVILEDSIKLAMVYYQDDRKAIQSGNLVNLPYMAFSAQRLALAQKWLASVIEWKYAYDFSVSALQQWLNVALAESNLQRATFAEEIVKVDGVLKDLSDDESAIEDAAVLKQRVRFMRGLLRKTIASLGQKLQIPLNSGGNGGSSGVTIPAADGSYEARLQAIAPGQTWYSDSGYAVTIIAIYPNSDVIFDFQDSSYQSYYGRQKVNPQTLGAVGACSKGVCEGESVMNPDGSQYARIKAVYKDGRVAARYMDSSTDSYYGVQKWDPALIGKTSGCIGSICVGDKGFHPNGYAGRVRAVYQDGKVSFEYDDANMRQYYGRVKVKATDIAKAQ